MRGSENQLPFNTIANKAEASSHQPQNGTLLSNVEGQDEVRTRDSRSQFTDRTGLAWQSRVTGRMA